MSFHGSRGALLLQRKLGGGLAESGSDLAESSTLLDPPLPLVSTYSCCIPGGGGGTGGGGGPANIVDVKE